MKRQHSALRGIRAQMARLLRDDHGGETVEYALTLGFLAVACYVLIQCVGIKFFDFWYRIDQTLGQFGAMG